MLSPTLSRPAPANHKRLNVLQAVGICGGGLGRHVSGLCRSLADQGHSVTVAYAPHDVDPAFQRFVERWRTEIRFVPLETPREINPVADLKSVARLSRLIRHDGPFDVVHGHSAKGGAIARIAGRLLGVPTVYTPHSLVTSSPDIPKRKAAVYNTVERVLGRLATSRMIAVSEGERDLALKLGLASEDRLVLIPNGVEKEDLRPSHDGDVAAPGLRQRPLTFGTTVRFTRQKAPGLLVEAFARLTRNLPTLPMRLVMAGDGELFGEVERRVRAEGLDDKISLLGWCSDPSTVLRELDVFVLPSLYEGFSYSVLEAMAARLPVVSTEVFGAAEATAGVAGNVLVPAGDPEALMRGMKRTATTAEPSFLRQSLRSVGDSNHAHVKEHFSQAESYRRIAALYLDLCL